jgi:hypothetical protein
MPETGLLNIHGSSRWFRDTDDSRGIVLGKGTHCGDQAQAGDRGCSNEHLQQRLHVISSFHSSRADGGEQIFRQ